MAERRRQEAEAERSQLPFTPAVRKQCAWIRWPPSLFLHHSDHSTTHFPSSVAIHDRLVCLPPCLPSHHRLTHTSNFTHTLSPLYAGTHSHPTTYTHHKHTQITPPAARLPPRSVVELSRGDQLRRETTQRLLALRAEQELARECTFECVRVCVCAGGKGG